MKLGQHQEAFARDLVSLLLKGSELGYACRIGEVLRPIEMQTIYVKTGRSKTMNSNHIKKCAADLHWVDTSGSICYPQVLGTFWEGLSPLNRWGGKWAFKDEPHYERNVGSL